MNGILVIDKPAGLTSHDVVARVRRILKTKHVGHTGTLDPFATGVLVILVGKATRLAKFLDKDEKEYQALVRFGYETDTGDLTGSPKSEVQGPTPEISDSDVERVLKGFRGEIAQTPPMYSAKKIDGKKLYELARKGKTIERQPIKVDIRKLEITDPPTRTDSGWDLGIHVICSAGGYIRTLAEDIGRKLGVGAHIQELRRTRAGKFDLSCGQTLEQLEACEDPIAALIPMNEAVSHLQQFVLPDDRIEKTRNGLSTRFTGDLIEGEAVQMLDESGNLVAIGHYRVSENDVQPKVVLI